MSGFGDVIEIARLPAGHRAMLDTWSESYSERFPDEGETSVTAYLYGPESFDEEGDVVGEPLASSYFGTFPRDGIDVNHVEKRWKDTLAKWRVKAHARAGSRGVREHLRHRRAMQARLRRGAARLGRQVTPSPRQMQHAEWGGLL